MPNFVKWDSLNQFHNVMKAINYRKYSEYLEGQGNKLEFYAKIKLHGTNASVTIDGGSVKAGKRSSFLPDGGIGGDNAGFAAWVKSEEQYFKNLSEQNTTYVLWGEWCGPGVQSGVACSMTEEKFFAVYALDIIIGDIRERVYDPMVIESFVDQHEANKILVLPYHCKVELNFADADKLRKTMDNINAEVESIGKLDPFINEVFEIEGAGEGLVFYPVIGEVGSYSTFEELELFGVFNFKAKSEAHRVNKTKESVMADPEQVATIKRFGEIFCTEQRFEQAFDEAVGRKKDIKLIGEFIKWCCEDVLKEGKDEIESLDVPWKKLSKVVSSRAATWYKAKLGEI